MKGMWDGGDVIRTASRNPRSRILFDVSSTLPVRRRSKRMLSLVTEMNPEYTLRDRMNVDSTRVRKCSGTERLYVRWDVREHRVYLVHLPTC
jgi:hypothetical protein